ncbi:MAG: SIR2 family protein, partial [Geovibrio sp.]|nr:SIR2 family protein [Geovibrio sp.]
TKIASVSDMTQIKDGVTQIVKFHGDFDNDDSLVLDESSYYERLEFETPLDIKLRSDVLGKSVLFIGYSLADVNLRFLFF